MSNTHQGKVELIKRMLLNLNLPVLPLNAVKSQFYVPDIITRVNTRFVVIEFINSKAQLNFDIGGLALIYNKDIIERFVAIIDNKLWNRYLRDFRLAKLNLPPRLDMIPFCEAGDYFAHLPYP